MVEVVMDNNYLSVESTKDGDIAVVVGEGEMVLKKVTWSNKEKEILNIPVEVSGKEMIWSPWDKDKKTCIEAWGGDTKNWVGKKFTIFHIDKKVVIRTIAEVKEKIVMASSG